jgi:formamidopyrimidine-DNA glycosylase
MLNLIVPVALYLKEDMPELPEVETIANGVNARTHGQTVRSVWTSNKPQTFKSPPDEIAEVLTGSRIDRVHRVGKTIVVDLVRNKKHSQFLVHLGMTGRLLVSMPDTPVPAHTHAVLTLSSGKELRFVDARRFGRLSVVAASLETKYEGPGKEPLTIGLEDFIALFRGRKTPIKAALLNQSLLHGVGNIYADEALFHAGIRSSRHAGRLTRAELTRLRAALIKVLTEAIQLGGSSVSDYVDADGVAGFFQLHHHVYSRTGQPCRICGTPIKRIVIGGRSTHFCPTCQK